MCSYMLVITLYCYCYFSELEAKNISLDNLVLSTGVIKWIGHRKESRKLTLRRRANARNVSFRISLRWPIHFINPVDKTKLSCYTPHRRSTTISLETYHLYSIFHLLCLPSSSFPNRYFLSFKIQRHSLFHSATRHSVSLGAARKMASEKNRGEARQEKDLSLSRAWLLSHFFAHRSSRCVPTNWTPERG